MGCWCPSVSACWRMTQRPEPCLFEHVPSWEAVIHQGRGEGSRSRHIDLDSSCDSGEAMEELTC